ncbi:unnamed protein product, partial [Rotaria socialis]
NKTGFQFNASAGSQYFRVYFKKQIHIGLVQVLTPRSNVKQIRLSYFDEYNQIIKNSELQGWPINYISPFGRKNNALDKLCPNFMFYGIQVDLLQTDPSNSPVHNATLTIHVRNCDGVGGRIPPCAETNIMYPQNLETYKFLSSGCSSDMTQAYENLPGENCQEKNPAILIKFQQPNLAYISTIEYQREYGQYPGNVRQIEAIFFDANNSIIFDEITGEPIRWISSENKPIISGDFQDVRGLILKVLKTDNDTNAQRIRVIMNGCYSAVKLGTYIIPEPRTTRVGVTIVSSCPNPIDLMANPSGKILSMTLNGEVIPDLNSISSASSGLTAKTGDKLQTWTIVTNLIDTVTSIGLVNSPNVIGPIQYKLHNTFHAVSEITGNYTGQIVPIYAKNIRQIVITTNIPTTDNQPPKNLKLILNGCFKQEQLRTIPQIEERISTTTSVVSCLKTNILTRTNMQQFSSPAAPLSDFSRAYANMRGEDLTNAPYKIYMFFNNVICVSDVLVQITAPGRSTSNVAQIEVSYKTSDGSDLKSANGSPIVLQSPVNNPTVTEIPLRCNIQGINVTILGTTDQKPPSFVRLIVDGCYGPLITILPPSNIFTTTPPSSMIGSSTGVPSCTKPIEMTRSNDSYFSSIIVDGVSYLKAPYPTSFVMKTPTMKIQFATFQPATITSVSVLNPNESQITSMIAETDYNVNNSTNLDGLRVNFQPNVDFNTHIIITLKTTMANAIFPKTIQLAIYGCGQPSLPVTKAQ